LKEVALFGAPHSLYTGRARSYLIKAAIPYREQNMGSQHYGRDVLPKAGGRPGMPTIETTNGDVIRDSAAIIDHFEAETGHPFSPLTPKQRFISRLFDTIGAEGLLRPAMHYRWNFPEENDAFLKFHFEAMMPQRPDKVAWAEAARNDMRGAAQIFGVNPETTELVEKLYLDVVEALNNHFDAYPYLLGGKPCIGDFGLIAPMFAHLGRDPKPLSILQSQAFSVLRWIERMGRLDADVAEYVDPSQDFLDGDQIPDTLLEVLKTVAVDFVPETRAAADTINRWLKEQENLEAGTTVERGLGFSTFEIDGVTVSALAQPYRFYLLKRMQDEFEQMIDADKNETIALLDRCNMGDVIDIKLTREIGRNNNLEVWL
jgi:glutathione S-transferase